MASIRKRGQSWQIIVSEGYDSLGKKIMKTKTVKKPENMSDKRWEKELEKMALEFEIEVQKGMYIDSKITLRDFSERWFKEYGEKQLKENTLVSYKDELNSKILPALGHIKLEKLTPVQILSFLNNLMEDGVRLDGKPGGYSDRTIRYQWQILSSMLQQAVYWQILPDNPCKRVKVPKNTKNHDQEFSNSKVKHFNENQTIILLDLIKKEEMKYQIATNIAIFCALRPGEILGLTWNDIDFKNKTISVNKSRTYIPKAGMITTEAKTEGSNRIISMPDLLIKLLKEYKVIQNGEKALIGDLWDEEWKRNPWLMTQWNGKGMFKDVLSKWLKKTITKYNESIINDESIIAENKKDYLLPKLSFHKLRHTSATLLISENTDIRTVSSRLGHAKTSTTLNIYVHSLQSGDIKAANTLENLLDKGNVNSDNRLNAQI